MPAEFAFPMRLATTARTPSDHMDFWAPESIDPGKAAHTRPDAGFGAVARLKPGVSIGQAQQDLASIGLQLQRLYPRDNGLQGRTLSLASLRARTLGFTRTGLLLLMGAAAIFMLIGCANVANLLLAKAIARNREIGVRLALGAGRVRIVRQLVTEACVLALAGGIVGYALTVFAWTLLPSVAPMSIPRLAAARADGTVFAFALTVSILNGILFGIAPALRPLGAIRHFRCASQVLAAPSAAPAIVCARRW
jgi:putative ABC transport system permease protein